jgi:hypothetical protein
MWLDTEAARLDVARAVRDADARGAAHVRPRGPPVHLRDDDTLVVAGRIIELERQVVRLPKTGEAVEGPALAICPRAGCGRRARVLWALRESPNEFACRACSGIRYASSSTSDPAERARLALEGLRAKLALAGYAEPPRRPYQHAATHERERRRLAEARARLESVEEAGFRRSSGRRSRF